MLSRKQQNIQPAITELDKANILLIGFLGLFVNTKRPKNDIIVEADKDAYAYIFIAMLARYLNI